MRQFLAVLSTLCFLLVVACSKQTVGQRCSPAFGSGSDGDCESPLVCTKFSDTLAYCCPSVATADTPAQCRALPTTTDAGVTPFVDAGSDAGETKSDAGAVDSGMDAADITDAASDASAEAGGDAGG